MGSDVVHPYHHHLTYLLLGQSSAHQKAFGAERINYDISSVRGGNIESIPSLARQRVNLQHVESN